MGERVREREEGRGGGDGRGKVFHYADEIGTRSKTEVLKGVTHADTCMIGHVGILPLLLLLSTLKLCLLVCET